MEHIAPQAARNLNITAVVMDNGVYGLTKGQASPTTTHEKVTSSTPFGKMEEAVNPLDLYLTLGVTYIASGYSSKPKDLANLMLRGMEHKGFSIVHVASPCTTYNDTYTQLKGSPKQGIAPTAWNIPADHDPSDKRAARDLIARGGVPVGVLYEDKSRPSFDERYQAVRAAHKPKSAADLLAAFDL
jgi:2-oxoglutarate ferredoxin oxidoreductase subunit beta